jgi:hypothetical protein
VCFFEDESGRLEQHPLRLAAPEYVRLGCLTFGLHGWQRFFFEGEPPSKKDAKSFMQRLEAIAPTTASEFVQAARI